MNAKAIYAYKKLCFKPYCTSLKETNTFQASRQKVEFDFRKTDKT